MYIVDGDLLTAVGDAIREKGELSRVTQLPLIKKSSNAITGTIPAETPDTPEDQFEETFVVNGASSVRVTAYCRLPCCQVDGAGTEVHTGFLYINGWPYENSANNPAEVRTITVTVPGESVKIKWYIDTVYGWSSFFVEKNRFYYIEIEGLDADGNVMETYNKPLSNGTDGLTLEEMAEAIGATVRVPLSEDEIKVLTTNGVHDMNGYRWADVKIPNDSIPTTYKEVVVTSEDNIHFDLSDYILNDKQIFVLEYYTKVSTSGTASNPKHHYKKAWYFHSPMTKDLPNMVFGGMQELTEETVEGTGAVHGGTTTFIGWPHNNLNPGDEAHLENGVLHFTHAAPGSGDAKVGTSAVLRYLE
jgi:hypothetical protein